VRTLRYFAVKNVVKNNKIHDCGLTGHGEGIYTGTASDKLWMNNNQIDQSTENLIEGNEIYNVEEGIDVKPGSTNNTISNNIVHNATREGSGGINVRSNGNYIIGNSSYENREAGFRIGTSSGGVDNILRANIAISSDVAGYKFINGPQDADCTNTGADNGEARLYYFADGVDNFLQCEEDKRFTIEQPWEAEYGEVATPVRVVSDPSASNGKYIVWTDGAVEAHAGYDNVIPRDGEYQFKAKVKFKMTHQNILE
jgi:parallel beta-helix repeat protein